MRECAAEQLPSSWLRARVAKGLPTAPLRQFVRAKSRKAAQKIRVPGSGLPIWIYCRNFVSWPHKPGLLTGIFWSPRTEKGPYRYERFGAFLAPGMWRTLIDLLRQRHPGRETQTPVPTKLGSVDLHVETQVCADPTLQT